MDNPKGEYFRRVNLDHTVHFSRWMGGHGGHDTAFAQIFEATNVPSYVKCIELRGRWFHITSHAGECLMIPDVRVVCCEKISEQDLTDLRAHGRVLSSQERNSPREAPTPVKAGDAKTSIAFGR
jgi:hypothetical protein